MKKFLIIIPIYNDWDSVHELVVRINKEIKSINHKISIIIINDSSNQKNNFELIPANNIQSVKILI